VKTRTWDDYSIGRATTQEHLAALDVVYQGIIEAHRDAIELVGDLDPITEDILIGQTAGLEQFHWFVRAHLENSDGVLSTAGASTERGAARRAVRKAAKRAPAKRVAAARSTAKQAARKASSRR
jgi:starvation-inducible DNA-binding protein